MEKERLDKILSQRTMHSRKKSAEFIKNGKVTVDGAVCFDPSAHVCAKSQVTLLGEKIPGGKYVYLMLNKPAGIVSSTRDPGCKTVLDLVPSEYRVKGLFPAGRLDKDTTGLILLTNDGQFAHRMLSPRSEIPKTYRVRLKKELSPQMIEILQKGVVIEGKEVRGKCWKIAGNCGEECLLEIYRGLYHQVKRMIKISGNEVIGLHRIKIGNLELPQNLPESCIQALNRKEIERLFGRICGK